MNHKIAQMEIIKEHFHQLFECPTYLVVSEKVVSA